MVSDATSSGPAANTTPSPTLLMTVADRSQRKLRPSLLGARVSTGRASRERTGGRIATPDQVGEDRGPRLAPYSSGW